MLPAIEPGDRGLRTTALSCWCPSPTCPREIDRVVSAAAGEQLDAEPVVDAHGLRPSSAVSPGERPWRPLSVAEVVSVTRLVKGPCRCADPEVHGCQGCHIVGTRPRSRVATPCPVLCRD